ncbi:ZFP90-like protein [Mya arenaria]|uniref:ZFP90-like protein n=1 Tax=Mya arenaria TaxID=6604 RepID=A0ABY7EAV8_MYAAR|nr:ZFP90-like protein [Mya arenaria]
MHLCSADKNIPWNQVKALIQGRCENTEPFTCAACLASFENICLLHYHCIQHNGTGSYSFDSKTNTAFPRYDYHCKSSLVTDDDFDLDKHGDNVTILYGRPGNFGFNDGSMIDNEEEDKLEENCAECPDEDTDVTNNSHQKDAIGTVQIIDTEENNASTNSIPVEICNVTRTPEGWIVFEIAEDQLNLYNATADISHMIQHGERKWKCPHCDAAFFKRNYLENHVLKHTGEDPFRHQCDLCGEKFKESYILRRHVKNYHNQIRDFQCRICKRMFFRADSRDQHEQRHYEAYLQCSYCPKKFKAKLDLRKHELTHTGDKQFFCPICMQGFGQIWPYYKHMWRIHNVQKDRAKEMRIKNPAIVNMRNINDEERTCGEEIILPPENRKIVQNELMSLGDIK